MDTTIRAKLERWMRRQVLTDEEERGRCKKFTIRHVSGGRAAGDLGSIPVPKKMDGDGWFSESVNAIEQMIFDDAEGIGGIQTYVVFPFFELRPDRPGSRFTIRESAASEDPDDVESEPPTKTGILTQMMRHTEAATRMSLMSTNQIITVMRNQLSRQADTIEKLVGDKMANLELMERMRSEELERRLLVENAERDAKIKGELMDKVGMLVPVVINRLTGKNTLPAKKTAMESMIQGLIESITPDQIEKLQGILSPPQIVTLMELFQSVQPPEGANGGTRTKQ